MLVVEFQDGHLTWSSQAFWLVILRKTDIMCEIVGYFRFLWSYSSSLQTLRVKRRVFMGHAVGVLEDIRALLADPGESQQWRHLDACVCVCVCADSVAVVEERPNQVQHGPHYWRPFTRHHRLFRQRQVRIPTSVTSSATFSIGQIFNGRSCQECRTALSCQISLKSLEPRPRYVDLLIFQDGGRPPYWICYRHISRLRRLLGGLYHCAKFGCSLTTAYVKLSTHYVQLFGATMTIKSRLQLRLSPLSLSWKCLFTSQIGAFGGVTLNAVGAISIRPSNGRQLRDFESFVPFHTNKLSKRNVANKSINK